MVIAEALQLALHIGNSFVGRETVVAVDRLIGVVVGVVGIVTPRWIPPAVIPAPVTAADEDDRVTMIVPPAAAVTMAMLAVLMSRLAPVARAAVPTAEAILCLPAVACAVR